MNEVCLFCRIIAGDVEAMIVYEDETTVVFLDHRPLFPGHCLVTPRDHYETLDNLPHELTGEFFKKVQQINKAVEIAMESEGTFVAMNNRVSQSVPHLHVHVVPRRRKDGLKGFFWPRNKYESAEAMKKTQTAIQKTIRELQK